MTVAENIRKLRKEKGWTQSRLGSECGLSEAMIRQYELGLRNPKIETLRKIANALSVSIGNLDPEYTDMVHDRNETFNLICQLEKFIEEIPKMNMPDDVKHQNLIRANDVLEKAKELVTVIDTGISRDKEMKVLLNENQCLKKEIQEAEQDINVMILSILRRLNYDGQDKIIHYALDLSKIPEYQKDEPTE